MEHLETQNCVEVAICGDEGQATGTVQWLLERKTCHDASKNTADNHPDDVPEITTGNNLDFFICGQEGFGALACDLLDAEATVDIICWGFDPGMELIRYKSSDVASTEPGTKSTWPRGETYGELLEKLARGDGTKKKPIKVRLLLWYDRFSSGFQGTVPGYEPGFGRDALDWFFSKFLSSSYDCKPRDDYCREWWERNLPRELGGRDEDPPIQIVLRSVKKKDVEALINTDIKEEDKPENSLFDPAVESIALHRTATHHQKPVLIDYGYGDGNQAVGYVMGLNSVTDYWDTTEHLIDSELREKAAKNAWKDEIVDEYRSDTGTGWLVEKLIPISVEVKKVHGEHYKSTKPYQDYACRIQGPALESLHENFEQGWREFAPDKWKETKDAKAPEPVKQIGPPINSVQIVRTLAYLDNAKKRKYEKTIKKLYFQSTSFARNYIYIENQYFFYPEFVRHLKAERKKYREQWGHCSHNPLSDMPTLYLFIVIPHPERDGMVPRTFDTLTELGMSDAMRGQAGYVDKGGTNQSYPDSAKEENGKQVLERKAIAELVDELGIKVSVVRLCTSGMVTGMMAYREIYIHSKLMLIDDVFVTLGSANINQRSMSADSEINVAATSSKWASDLRRRVFNLHSGDTISGDGGGEAVPDVFLRWNNLAEKNYNKWKLGKKQLTGFLVRFEDMRSSWYKVA